MPAPGHGGGYHGGGSYNSGTASGGYNAGSAAAYNPPPPIPNPPPPPPPAPSVPSTDISMIALTNFIVGEVFSPNTSLTFWNNSDVKLSRIGQRNFPYSSINYSSPVLANTSAPHALSEFIGYVD